MKNDDLLNFKKQLLRLQEKSEIFKKTMPHILILGPQYINQRLKNLTTESNVIRSFSYKVST